MPKCQLTKSILLRILSNSIELPINANGYKVWLGYQVIMFFYDIAMLTQSTSISKHSIHVWLIVDIIYSLSIVSYHFILKKIPQLTSYIGVISFCQLTLYISEPKLSVSKDAVILFINLLIAGIVSIAFIYDSICSVLEGILLETLYYGFCFYSIYHRTELSTLQYSWLTTAKYVIYCFIVSLVLSIFLLSGRLDMLLNKLKYEETLKSWKTVMNNISSSISIEKKSRIIYRNKLSSNLFQKDIPLYKDSNGKLPIISSNSIEKRDIIIRKKRVFFHEESCNLYITHEYIHDKSEENLKYCQLLVATITHELRAPLGIIMHVLNVFIENVKEESLKQQAKQAYLASTLQECMINDILDVAKINNNTLKISLAPANVRKILEEMHYMFQLKIDNSIIYSMDIDDRMPNIIMIDERRFKQILINLLSNSIKFTSKGYISIHSHFCNGLLYCSVADSGVGIAEEEKGIIFQQFGMAESQKAINKSGTGLGLNLCKKLLNAMNGDITFTSEKNKCTVFTFWIPCLEFHPNIEKPKVVSRHYSLQEFKLLCIDDDYLSLRMLDYYAAKLGVEHHSFMHGEDAITKVKSGMCFTLAFVDINMPQMNGYEVATMLKALNNKITLIAMTGEDRQSIECKAYANGFSEVIEKPVSYEAFSKCVSKYQ